jgi:Cu+-exporting ATPase
MAATHTIEVPIEGMDCADCTQHVKHALEKLPSITSVEVLLGAQKAIITMQGDSIKMAAIRTAVEKAGYSVPQTTKDAAPTARKFSRNMLTMLAMVVGALLFIVVVGEWLGFFEMITKGVSFWLGATIVLIGGLPIFIDVIRAALQKQITSRTLMTLGVIAALAVKQWTTAGIVVFMMHIGNFVEGFTADRSRKAMKDLTKMAPQTARVVRNGEEITIPVEEVQKEEIVIVRPGEAIPVDGEVVEGNATIDQAAVTGESFPIEVGKGARVYAATVAQLGSIKIKTVHVGRDSTFGQVIKLVEEAESKKGKVQQFADKFAGYYLPIVAGIALLTLIIKRDALAAAAVLVVACSCTVALATPIAMLASIGAGAKRGLLIRGGKYLESLSKVDVMLIDKTGTLTLGKPRLTDVMVLNGLDENALLQIAASAERYSEHPLANALREAAEKRNVSLLEIMDFESIPGKGVRAKVNGFDVRIGNTRFIENQTLTPQEELLRNQGKTLLFVEINGKLAGILAAADTLRDEAPASIRTLHRMGVHRIELLTGDNANSANELSTNLGIPYQANLLPEDKIRIVKEYQAEGHTVAMIGDGINDAPALAQADIGIAMGASGTDIALETADIVLLQDDWTLVPQVVHIAKRTMGVVRMNLIFTAVYNVIGISLAALGILPPVLAAALQSIPDLGILGNSSRLLKPKRLDIH